MGETDGLTKEAAGAGWTGGSWAEIEAAWDALRRAIEPWLADAEQRIREMESGPPT